MDNREIRLWFWTITDPLTKKRRRSTYRMTEETARERYGADAVKVGEPFVPPNIGGTSDFQKR